MYKFIGILYYEMKNLAGISVILGFITMVAMIGLPIVLFIHTLYNGYTKFTFPITCGIVIASLIGLGAKGAWTSVVILLIAHSIYAIKCFMNNYNHFNRYIGWSSLAASLDFKTLKNLYDLNSRRLTFWDYRECSYRTANCESVTICIPNKIEYLKFLLWRYKIRKIEQKRKDAEEKVKYNQNNVEATQLILDQAQLDIEALRKKAEREFNEAARIIKEVAIVGK